MPISLSGRHFLTLLDFTPEEIRHLLRLSKRFKSLKRAGTPHRRLQGRNVVLLFEKTSTRTRCAFVPSTAIMRRMPMPSHFAASLCHVASATFFGAITNTRRTTNLAYFS